MASKFSLKMSDFHVAFMDLLHAVNLRHGIQSFTLLPMEGVLRIFFALKNPTASAEFESAKASTLPLDHGSRFNAEVNNEESCFPSFRSMPS
jgi:hypothetical protein